MSTTLTGLEVASLLAVAEKLTFFAGDSSSSQRSLDSPSRSWQGFPVNLAAKAAAFSDASLAKYFEKVLLNLPQPAIYPPEHKL